MPGTAITFSGMSKVTRRVSSRATRLPAGLLALLFVVCASLVNYSQAATNQFIHEFPVPTLFSQPTSITKGPDGNLWFTEFFANKIGRIKPSGLVTEYLIPTANSQPFDIVVGPDGNLWFTESGSSKIGCIKTNGVILHEYHVPTTNSTPGGITVGPDNNLWFTEFNSGKIGRVSTNGVFNEYHTGLATNSFIYRITKGPDNNLWFTETGVGKIGRINPTNFVIDQFPLALASQPFDIIAGSDNALWFSEYNSNKIGRITIDAVPTINEYTVPRANPVGTNGIYGLVLGSNNTIWFSEHLSSYIGSINVSSTATNFSKFPVPTTNSTPAFLTTDSGGNIWFTEIAGNNIGKLPVTQQPSPPPSQPNLSIGLMNQSKILITWPTNATGFKLQSHALWRNQLDRRDQYSRRGKWPVYRYQHHDRQSALPVDEVIGGIFRFLLLTPLFKEVCLSIQ